ncbi:MAG: hypothetical protein AAF630_10060 [Cyanobacteria bacterium P01_C01_bin.38]
MSQSEYSDRQELENEVKENFSEIETLGEQQKDHQEDLESLQESLRKLKMSKGVYSDSDYKLYSAMETAIQTRETDVNTCKDKISYVKHKMQLKHDNLQRSIQKQEERITQMEETVASLNHKNERVDISININIEIERQKDDTEHGKDNDNKLIKGIGIADGLTGVGVAASGIAELINALQSIGLFK